MNRTFNFARLLAICLLSIFALAACSSEEEKTVTIDSLKGRWLPKEGAKVAFGDISAVKEVVINSIEGKVIHMQIIGADETTTDASGQTVVTNQSSIRALQYTSFNSKARIVYLKTGNISFNTPDKIMISIKGEDLSLTRASE